MSGRVRRSTQKLRVSRGQLRSRAPLGSTFSWSPRSCLPRGLRGGWGARSFSSKEAGNFEILLSDASQVRPDGSLLPIHGEGVLL